MIVATVVLISGVAGTVAAAASKVNKVKRFLLQTTNKHISQQPLAINQGRSLMGVPIWTNNARDRLDKSKSRSGFLNPKSKIQNGIRWRSLFM
jgi:asparagine N-glycosylation enzyme membrane subunit Stt3